MAWPLLRNYETLSTESAQELKRITVRYKKSWWRRALGLPAFKRSFESANWSSPDDATWVETTGGRERALNKDQCVAIDNIWLWVLMRDDERS